MSNTLQPLPSSQSVLAEIKKDMETKQPQSQSSDLESEANEAVKQLLDANQDGAAKVEIMGMELQKRAAKQSTLLKQPIKALSQRSADEGDVANTLIQLKMKVEELDPGKFDFESGWLTRALGKIPGFGSPIKRYFSKYESAQTAISAIVRSLENGRDQLLRDNVTLIEDQKQMKSTAQELDHSIRLGQLMDQKLQYKLDREITAEHPQHKYVSEELLYPMRQRIMDLQTQLAVQQQGIIATELIIRNNKELARGVNRALNVTVSALEVGATVAMALANQKIVLEKIQAVNETTSNLIAGTAAQLKTQGAAIHKQASSSQISMESLKAAFGDLKTALNDISTFRQQALPQMAQSILELDQVSKEADQVIQKMEAGNRAMKK